MAFLLVISTSLWLYNLLELRKEVRDEIEYLITTLGHDVCKNCVEFLPSYAVLFASVVSCYFFLVLGQWQIETCSWLGGRDYW